MVQPVGIDEASLAQPTKGLPLGLRDVGATVAGRGIPDVDIRRRHVEVPAEHARLLAIPELVEPNARGGRTT
jgi:hypothetical protein